MSIQTQQFYLFIIQASYKTVGTFLVVLVNGLANCVTDK